MKPRLLPLTPTEQEIEHAAYFLWEAAGRPTGRDRELWFTAREQLCHRLPLAAFHPRRTKPAHLLPRSAQSEAR
jgi:hypothetical protein